MEKCYNGCGNEFNTWDMIQISYGGLLMLVCEECLIEDSSLDEWETDFVTDPRYR